MMAKPSVGPVVGPVASIAYYYRLTYERILSLVEDLSDEQVAQRTKTTKRSLALILWHIARWTDVLQASLPEMTPELGHKLGLSGQIWKSENLAAKWGFEASSLGYSETGWLMDDVEAANLPLPPKDVLLDYIKRTFAKAESAIDALDDESFQALQEQQTDNSVSEEMKALTRTVGNYVLLDLTHFNRHLGEMEHMRGELLGLNGSVSEIEED